MEARQEYRDELETLFAYARVIGPTCIQLLGKFSCAQLISGAGFRWENDRDDRAVEKEVISEMVASCGFLMDPKLIPGKFARKPDCSG